MQRSSRPGSLIQDPLPARLGAALALLAVALGAFGAHALRGMLEPSALDTYETAVRYQMYHALGLLGVGALRVHGRGPAWLLFFGSVVFSGSLYLLVWTGVDWLGAITPIGGVMQLAGWAWLLFALGRSSPIEGG